MGGARMQLTPPAFLAQFTVRLQRGIKARMPGLKCREFDMRHSVLILLAAAFSIAVAMPPAAAQQSYPARPIKIVAPYPPGGASDITTRIFAAALPEFLGQPVVVENKPGGGTNIAAEYVARAAPDGYTLYVANFASHAVNRHLFAKLPFHPVKDFTRVAMMNRVPMFLCVRKESSFRTVADLVEHGRKNPGKLTYGTPGNGSPPHICGEQLKQLGKFDALHVPYKGVAEAAADMMAGQIDFMFDAATIAHHRAGRVRCIGVSYKERWPTEPEIPTLAESGVPGFDLIAFFGIVGPANMPRDIVEKLNAAFVAVARKPETIEKTRIAAVVPWPATIAETEAFLDDVDERWGPVVKASGAKID